MEFRHLKYFLVLAEELHFGRASDRLFIAQPALSRQIKDLEAELKVTLFDRNKRHVALTFAGEYLQKEGYEILKQMENVKDSISDFGKTLKGKITIGCIGSAINVLIPDLLKRMQTELPGIRTQLVEDTTQNLQNALIDGKIDITFSRPMTENLKIRSKVVFQESTVAVAAKKSRWGIRSNSQVSDFRNVPFILFPREAGFAYRDRIMQVCAAYEVLPDVIHETLQANTLLRLVEQDLGVSIVPQSLVSGFNLKIDVFKIRDFEIPVDLALSYRADRKDQVLESLIGLIPASPISLT